MMFNIVLLSQIHGFIEERSLQPRFSNLDHGSLDVIGVFEIYE